MSDINPTIDSLRVHIDRIDTQIHDLLMERSKLVERIGSLKAEGNLALRPGREADILRRLSDRHRGSFPKPAIMRIWREILGGLTNMQRPMIIAIAQNVAGSAYIELVRDHFGVTPAVRLAATPGQVVKLVADEDTPIGVVPVPGYPPAGNDPWWAALIPDNAPRIISRLPFYPYERTDPVDGLVLAKRPQDQTGQDRTYVVIETTAPASIDRIRALMTKAEFMPTGQPQSTRLGDLVGHLIEVEGWVAPTDPRLSALVRDQVTHAVVIGGYPIPLSL